MSTILNFRYQNMMYCLRFWVPGVKKWCTVDGSEFQIPKYDALSAIPSSRCQKLMMDQNRCAQIWRTVCDSEFLVSKSDDGPKSIVLMRASTKIILNHFESRVASRTLVPAKPGTLPALAVPPCGHTVWILLIPLLEPYNDTLLGNNKNDNRINVTERSRILCHTQNYRYNDENNATETGGIFCLPSLRSLA